MKSEFMMIFKLKNEIIDNIRLEIDEADAYERRDTVFLT